MKKHDRRGNWPPRRQAAERAEPAPPARSERRRTLQAAFSGTAKNLAQGTLSPFELRRIVAGVIG
ncbi:MAG: hypothetical protein ACXWUN_12635 [Allosphingosinicella sp.]